MLASVGAARNACPITTIALTGRLLDVHRRDAARRALFLAWHMDRFSSWPRQKVVVDGQVDSITTGGLYQLRRSTVRLNCHTIS